MALLILLSLSGVAPCSGIDVGLSSEPFLFIGVYGAGAGGRTVADRFVSVSGTNYAQSCSVKDEVVIALQTKRVSAEGLLKHVATLAGKLPQAFVRRGENLPSVDAFIPTYIRISFQLPSGLAYDWANYETQLSTSQKDIILRAEELVRSGQSLTNEEPFAYLAAYWLDDRTASQFKREGLLQTVEPGSLSPTSSLFASLRHPFRLVPVKQGVNPFEPYHRSFRPGRDVLDATCLGKAFQVRSYTTKTIK